MLSMDGMLVNSNLTRHRVQPDRGTVLSKAVLRAADLLGINARTLATVIGLSEATLSRIKRGEFVLQPGTKPFELSVLFVRMFRSLDAIVGGDAMSARSWMSNPNAVLDGRPIEKIRTIAGLMDVIAYLDARRARI